MKLSGFFGSFSCNSSKLNKRRLEDKDNMCTANSAILRTTLSRKTHAHYTLRAETLLAEKGDSAEIV